VFLRDLDELRSERLAAENPPVEVLEEVKEEQIMDIEETHDLPQEYMAENNQSPLKLEPEAEASRLEVPTVEEPSTEAVKTAPDSSTLLSPPSSNDTKPIGSIDTAPNDAPTTEAPLLPDSSTDNLFDMTDSNDMPDTNDMSDLDFAVDFLNDTNTNDNSQTQNTEFDLSTFGNTQEFNMPDLQASAGTNTANNATDNSTDDLFGVGNTSGGDDLMDLDTSMLPAEENTFDDLFFTGDDGDNMDDGTFDDAYFNLNG
jgi:hypothetical protein